MKLNRFVIKVADYRMSFNFYHDILSLHLQSSWQRSDSWGALFNCGDVILEIVWFPEGEGSLDCNYIPPHSKTELFFSVSNVNSIYQRLINNEGLDISPIEEMSWGFKIFSVYDPDHVKVVFAQPI
jgi:catechol 2,3-dioxygenase-like lactoylglutathione lyase family enzyme